MNSSISLGHGKIIDLVADAEADVGRRSRGRAIRRFSNELGAKGASCRLVQALFTQGYFDPNDERPPGFRLVPAVQIPQGLTLDRRRLPELGEPVLARLVDGTTACAPGGLVAGNWALANHDEAGQIFRFHAGTGGRVLPRSTSPAKLIPPEQPNRGTRTNTRPETFLLHLAEVTDRSRRPEPRARRPRRVSVSGSVSTPAATGSVALASTSDPSE